MEQYRDKILLFNSCATRDERGGQKKKEENNTTCTHKI